MSKSRREFLAQASSSLLGGVLGAAVATTSQAQQTSDADTGSPTSIRHGAARRAGSDLIHLCRGRKTHAGAANCSQSGRKLRETGAARLRHFMSDVPGHAKWRSKLHSLRIRAGTRFCPVNMLAPNEINLPGASMIRGRCPRVTKTLRSLR